MGNWGRAEEKGEGDLDWDRVFPSHPGHDRPQQMGEFFTEVREANEEGPEFGKLAGKLFLKL